MQAHYDGGQLLSGWSVKAVACLVPMLQGAASEVACGIRVHPQHRRR